MKRFSRLLTSGLILFLVAAACGGAATAIPTPISSGPVPAATVEPTAVPVTTDTPVPSPTPEAMALPSVGSAKHSKLGTILVDGGGNTLYLLTSDEQGVSTCSGGCAGTWPPLVTVGDPVAGEGVDGGLLGTVTREDGSVQIAYNGWPLYSYAGDQKPGDTNGQEVGVVWFTVSTAGDPNATDSAASGGDY